MIALVLYILAAICFALAFFDKTLDGHSLVAAGLFCWVVAIIFASEIVARRVR